MTTEQMVDAVKSRTRQTDDTKVVRELNSSLDWAYTKVFNSAGGPDILLTFGTEKTMAAVTRVYDMGANITGTLYFVKQLWLRLPGEVNFTPMVPRDAATDAEYILADQYPASDTTNVATGHPVRYDIFNFSQVRFSPMLPTGSIIRIDGCIKPPDIDPTQNPTLTYANDIPEPTHEAIVDKATAQVFEQLNDDRWKDWLALAERRLNDALYLLTRRNQGPTVTTAFRVRRRRWI